MSSPPPIDPIPPGEEHDLAENRRRQVERLGALRVMLRSFDALEALMLVATPLAGNVDPARSSARPTPGVVQFLALLTATDGGRELFDTADRAAAAASEMLRLASDAVRSEALFDFIRDRSQARFASISSTSRREWSESRVGIHALRSVAGRMGYIEQRPLPSPHVLRTASSAAVASYDGQAPEAERLFRDEVGWTAMQGVCIADVMIRMIFRLSIRRDPAQRVPTMQGLFPSRRSTGISASALLSEIPSELGITLAAVEAFLRDMTTSAESVLLCARREKALLADDLVLPHAPNDLWWRPLIADAQRALWYAPAPQLLFGGIERRIADILATDATSPPSEAKQRFRSQRASWAEKEVASLLSAMVGSIGGSPEVALNVEWSHGGLSAPANGEVDVIVALDEIAILVECKSGVWSDAKGKDSKSDLIEKPIEQLASIGLALATGGQSLSLSSPSRIALPVQEELRIRRMLNKPVLVSMYVSLDELGQLGADLSRYRHAHKLPQETSLPYAVSHQDLLFVGEVLRGAYALAFLAQRARWNDEGSAAMSDETGLVSAFLEDRLWGDVWPSAEGGRAHIWRAWAEGQLVRFENGVLKLEMAEPDITVRLRPFTQRLIDLLDAQRPAGWTLACLTILSGGPTSEIALEAGLEVAFSPAGRGEVYSRREPELFTLVVQRNGDPLSRLRSDRNFLRRLLQDSRVPFALTVDVDDNGIASVTWVGDAQQALVVKRPHAISRTKNAGSQPDPQTLSDAESARLTPHERAALWTLLTCVPDRNDRCPCRSGSKWKSCHGR